MCTKVRKNIVGLKTTLKCAFVCNRDKKAPSFCPFFFRRPSSSSSFARECRTSLFTAAAALVRAISSLYLSRVPLRRACRPSFRTQYAVGLCLVLLSARCSVRSEWGLFSRLFLSRHHILPWSLSANCRKTMYCMQASSETIDSSCVWESQNLWEELVESNPTYIFPCCRCLAFRRWVVD